MVTDKDIITRYQEGKSISSLVRDTGRTRCSIEKLLQENKVAIRGGRKLIYLTNEQLDLLQQQYNEGIAKKQIGVNLGVSIKVINRAIQDLQLPERTRNRVNKRIKNDYFATIDSQEKAYWLGFLFTDGSVDYGKSRGRIRLQLQEADKEILEKFKEDLQIDSKIIYDRRPNSTCCSVEFVSEQMFNDLAKYGIVPRKTYVTERIPYELIPNEFIEAFILGLYDGDGGISFSADCSTDVTISFASYHESIAKDFRFLINTYVLKTDKENKVFFTSAWHTTWRGRLQVLKILDGLYENSSRHLQRKYEKYLVLKNSLK